MMIARPKRRMPSLLHIARFWGIAHQQPHCVRCFALAPVDDWRKANSYLQRAHIVDRIFDGLDVVWNIAPLCVRCHHHQPIFRAGEELDAIDWFGLYDEDELIETLGIERMRAWEVWSR